MAHPGGRPSGAWQYSPRPPLFLYQTLKGVFGATKKKHALASMVAEALQPRCGPDSCHQRSILVTFRFSDETEFRQTTILASGETIARKWIGRNRLLDCWRTEPAAPPADPPKRKLGVVGRAWEKAWSGRHGNSYDAIRRRTLRLINDPPAD